MRKTLNMLVLAAVLAGTASCTDPNVPPRPQIGLNETASVPSAPLPPPAGYAPPAGPAISSAGSYGTGETASATPWLVWHATPSWAVIKDDQ